MFSPDGTPSASPRSATSKSKVLLAHFGALAATLVWGLSFVSTKVLTDKGLHPIEIYLYRFILAYIILLIICHKKIFAYSLRDELLFVVLGLTGGSLYFIAENIAVTKTLVANVSLLTSLTPIITVFLVGCMYKSERPSKWIVLGSLIAIIGVAFVVLGASSTGIEVHPLGDFLALAAAFSFSIYSLVLKKINANYTTLFITRKTFFYGILTALPFLALEPSHAPLSVLGDPKVLINILFLGVFCSLMGFALMAQAVKVIGPVKANSYLYVQPIVTLLAGLFILHQTVGWTGWTGCALIIGGLWLGEELTRRYSEK
ncbi:MAG: DMT family transporter [Muribaculaceae bacterium]|nr:DMT family transporter [Muribaculaceae bacterium]